MRRARRLQLIADSYRPAFESETGMQWWLGGVQSNPEPVVQDSPAAASTAPAFARVRVSSAESPLSASLAVSLERDAADALETASPCVEQIATQDDGPTYTFADTFADAFEEKLTWDSRAACFVRA
jgi:lysozyme family protein